MHSRTSRRRLLQSSSAALACGWLGASALGQETKGKEVDDQETEWVATTAPRLKVTAVKTYRLETRLKRPFGASVSVPLPKTRDALLVKIETNLGIVGWGETSPINGARDTIDKSLAPKLIGKNPLQYRRLWRDLWGPNFGNGLAVGAVETAINDVRGKALNLPVSELFGGRFRNRVPVYVSALNYVEGRAIEEEYPKVAAELVAKGHKAIKMRLGRFSVARESKVVRKVREAVGPKVKLLADGNGAYTRTTALRMARVLDEMNFEYFEEPLPQVTPNYAGYEKLREKMPLPLAGGEGLDSRAAGKALLDRGCFDIIQPDLSLCGGLGEALFVAELAALHGVQCLPHCWGGDIVLAASAHLLSLLPEPHWGFPTDTPMLEVDLGENPWRDGLAKEPLQMKNGSLTVPTKPGLGIEVDEDVVRKYAVA